jgi:hypothetical protein
MRRLALVMAVIAAALLPPAAASAHTISKPCDISVMPGRGGPRDVYRIMGRNFPEEKNGGSLEVQIHVSRVVYTADGPSLKMKTLYFVFLIPNIHAFYVDFNAPMEGESNRLKPGHYVVAAETPHQRGCHTTTGFDVRRGG